MKPFLLLATVLIPAATLAADKPLPEPCLQQIAAEKVRVAMLIEHHPEQTAAFKKQLAFIETLNREWAAIQTRAETERAAAEQAFTAQCQRDFEIARNRLQQTKAELTGEL